MEVCRRRQLRLVQDFSLLDIVHRYLHSGISIAVDKREQFVDFLLHAECLGWSAGSNFLRLMNRYKKKKERRSISARLIYECSFSTFDAEWYVDYTDVLLFESLELYKERNMCDSESTRLVKTDQ